jgi:transposase InsO family protein
VVGEDHGYEYLIHDRDRIFAKHLDDSVSALGVEVLRSPAASPKANAVCERVIGTIRRECLDWMIPLSEAHLRSILKSWVGHYNRGGPIARWVQACRTLRINLWWSRSLKPDTDWRRARLCS